MIVHPLVAYRDCSSCRKWMYSEKTGEIEKKNQRDVPRGNSLPPCELPSVGCKKGHYNNQKVLSDRNYQAYRHYQECKAIGDFPDDSVVRMNARIISQTIELADRHDRSTQLGQLTGLMMLLGQKNGR